jgi:hypothetical protein
MNEPVRNDRTNNADNQNGVQHCDGCVGGMEARALEEVDHNFLEWLIKAAETKFRFTPDSSLREYIEQKVYDDIFNRPESQETKCFYRMIYRQNVRAYEQTQ